MIDLNILRKEPEKIAKLIKKKNHHMMLIN